MEKTVIQTEISKLALLIADLARQNVKYTIEVSGKGGQDIKHKVTIWDSPKTVVVQK